MVIRSRDIVPEEISKTLSMHPDASWRTGEHRPGTQIIEPENVWILKFGTDSYDGDLSLLIKDTLKTLSPKRGSLISLTKSCRAWISCAMYYVHPPSLFVERDVISELAGFNLGLDFDLYHISEEE